MKEKVREVIMKVYLEKEYDFYKKRCGEELRMSDKFCEFLKTSFHYMEMSAQIPNPAREWYVHFESVKKGEFSIKYNTVIKISKIVQVFNVQHEFEVENRDVNRIEPFLDGYSGEAYCKNQFKLHEKVRECLFADGFEELTYAEMHEVIGGLDMPNGITIFGNQMTVDAAIFKDVFDLCSIDY